MFDSELLVSPLVVVSMFSIRQHIVCSFARYRYVVANCHPLSLKCGKSSGIKVKVAFSKLRKTTWPMTSDFMTLA